MTPYVLAFSPQLDFKVLYFLSYFSSTKTVVRTKEGVLAYVTKIIIY